MVNILCRTLQSAALLSCAFVLGCASTDKASPGASTPLAAPAVDSVSTAPAPPRPEAEPEVKTEAPPAPSTTAPPAPSAAAPARKPAAAKDAANKPVPSTHATQQTETHAAPGSPPKTAAGAQADSKVSAPNPVVAEPARSTSPPPVARIPEPTLDVADLKARLRETGAIGTFTKLALKNQMDDLLDRFRAFYQSGQKTGVTALRQPFDALVVKVVTHLRPGDPSLARTIESSREAIWGILSNPEKFKSVG